MLGETGVQVETAGHGPGGTFAAALPAGAATVELLSGPTVVDRAARSRPPVVRLVAPRRGARVGGRLAVAWTASDPDRGALEAAIDFSADGGRTWRGVSSGPSRGRAVIPAGFLSGTDRARVRVRVSDGFNGASAQSGSFRVAGSPPRAQIVLPGNATTRQAGKALLLGKAFDDSQRRLRGRSLTWFAGGRRLGRGERRSATLPAGHYRLRLVVRDSRGRTATAVRRLRVTPVPLSVTELEAPARVKPGARTVAVKLGTTVPATVRAGGRSLRAGKKTRTLRLALPSRPKTGLVKLPVTIRAGAPSSLLFT